MACKVVIHAARGGPAFGTQRPSQTAFLRFVMCAEKRVLPPEHVVARFLAERADRGIFGSADDDGSFPEGMADFLAIFPDSAAARGMRG